MDWQNCLIGPSWHNLPLLLIGQNYLIGPFALLSIVSHFLESHFQVYGWGFNKQINNNGCEKY